MRRGIRRQIRPVHLQKPGHDTEDAGPHGHPRRRHVLSLCDGGRPQRADHEIARPGQLDAVRHGLLRGHAPRLHGGRRDMGPRHQLCRRPLSALLFALLVGRHRGLRHRRRRGRDARRTLDQPRQAVHQQGDRLSELDRPVLHRGGRREIPLLGKFPRHLGRPAVGRRARWTPRPFSRSPARLSRRHTSTNAETTTTSSPRPAAAVPG